MATLLSIQADAKTKKGNKLGVMTGILYLTPASGSGRNICPDASAGCIAACLNTAGRGIMRNVQAGRARKTELLFTDKMGFFTQLERDVQALVRKAAREDMQPAVRLNGTSDLPWERMRNPWSGLTIMETFPDVQFYDYTKSEARAIAWAKGEMPQNYDLTFSRSECNDASVERVLAAGGRVAVVYAPDAFDRAMMTAGSHTVDGDDTDVRFRDPRACIVALKAKGIAKRDESGFVVRF